MRSVGMSSINGGFLPAGIPLGKGQVSGFSRSHIAPLQGPATSALVPCLDMIQQVPQSLAPPGNNCAGTL
jgi:hypothetical protein